jgi:hypothetical protein
MRLLGLSIFLIILLNFSPAFAENIIINEIFPWGSPEWVELYNPTNETVNISGWFLDTNLKKDATLPENSLILPHGYFVVGDPGCGGDYEEAITITDGNVNIWIRNSLEEVVDGAVLEGKFSKTDGLSIQRANSTEWRLFAPTKGAENFPRGSGIEIGGIFVEGGIFVNNSAIISVKILNLGPNNYWNQTAILDIFGPEYDEERNYIGPNASLSATLNLSADSESEALFEWAPEVEGNYNLCAGIFGESLCQIFNASLLPEDNEDIDNGEPIDEQLEEEGGPTEEDDNENLDELQIQAVISPTIEGQLITGISYSKLFKIELLNKKKLEGNCNRQDTITVSFNIADIEGNIERSEEFSADVGCSKTAGTGSFMPKNAGDYVICGSIISSTAGFESEAKCKEFSVINSKDIPCNLSLKIESPLIWKSGESSKYSISVLDSIGNCSGCFAGIEYSIENAFEESLSGYPKGSQKSIGQENIFSFTPKLDCGSGVYKIKAKIANATCNDISEEGNSAQSIIGVIGPKKCEPCPVCPKETETAIAQATTSSSSELGIEFLSAKDFVARNEEFQTEFRIENRKNELIDFEVYSYVYTGSKCITGSWTKNLIEVSLDVGEEKVIGLISQIKKDAEPGEYIFRVRAKLDGKNIDLSRPIIVTEEILEYETSEDEIPKTESDTQSNPPGRMELNIWNDTKLKINLTNCEGCRLLISTPSEAFISSQKYRVFDEPGTYGAFAIKNGDVLFTKHYIWGGSLPVEGQAQEFRQTSAQNSAITGEVSKAGWKGMPKNITSAAKSAIEKLIRAMENSISR